MRISFRAIAALLLSALVAVPSLAHAQDKPASTPATTPAAPAKSAESAFPPDSSTQGSVVVGGQRIDYTATAGILTVGATDAEDAQLGVDGKPLAGTQLALSEPKNPAEGPALAHMFYVGYFKNGAKAENRPVTFFYNGGPGSSTMWLHLGSLGPKYVETASDQHLPGAPYKLRENPYSLLDVSDLVFIDMPGTGFGQLTGKDAGKAFWGLDQDAGAFARFIARFLTKYNRWNSPKYLFGESYGTTRSAVLANLLENDKNIDLNGVMLLGEIFNFTVFTGLDTPGVDLPYELALPTYAATAWYHKKLSPQPQALAPFLDQVEAFALGDYMHALAQGNSVSDAEKQAVAEKIHQYTGLPVAYILKANLRVTAGEFRKQFAGDEDMIAGRYDTRYLGTGLDPLSQNAEYDPQSTAISSAYVAQINSYVRNDLKFGATSTYLPSALFGDANWNWTRKGDGGISGAVGTNVSSDLADAMKTNPHLKVMVNDGYYDLATPYFAAKYEEEHLPIPKSLIKNIEYDWYEAGHMAYVRDECRQQMHDRVAAFIKSTEAERTAGQTSSK